MTLLDVSKLDAVGAPLYDMRKIFQIDAPASKISFSLITIHPGSRVPEVGDGFHSGDEYSYFLEGEEASRHRRSNRETRQQEPCS